MHKTLMFDSLNGLSGREQSLSPLRTGSGFFERPEWPGTDFDHGVVGWHIFERPEWPGTLKAVDGQFLAIFERPEWPGTA